MTDTGTQKPIRVSMDEATGPYTMLTVDAVEQVRKILLGNQIPHWADHRAISVDGKPFVTTIWTQRGNPLLASRLVDGRLQLRVESDRHVLHERLSF